MLLSRYLSGSSASAARGSACVVHLLLRCPSAARCPGAQAPQQHQHWRRRTHAGSSRSDEASAVAVVERRPSQAGQGRGQAEGQEQQQQQQRATRQPVDFTTLRACVHELQQSGWVPAKVEQVRARGHAHRSRLAAAIDPPAQQLRGDHAHGCRHRVPGLQQRGGAAPAAATRSPQQLAARVPHCAHPQPAPGPTSDNQTRKGRQSGRAARHSSGIRASSS